MITMNPFFSIFNDLFPLFSVSFPHVLKPCLFRRWSCLCCSLPCPDFARGISLLSVPPCSFTHLSRSSLQVFYFLDGKKLYTKRSKGRANVGKSSLLNAVLGRKSLLRISKKAVRFLKIVLLTHFP